MKSFSTLHTTSTGHNCLHCLMAAGLYIHILPGRLRIDLPGLKTNPALAQEIHRLIGSPEIHRVQCSPVTGRALVEFDPNATTVECILERLDAMGAFPQAKAEHVPLKQVTRNTMLDAASDLLIEKGLKLAFMMVA